jgi:CHAT domain-containing protein
VAKVADLGAVVAHTVVTLLASLDVRPSTRVAAEEAADACRALYASTDPIDDRLRPCLLWWSAAVESALAFTSPTETARASHRSRAVRDMRRAGNPQRVLATMDGTEISDTSAAVFVYAPMLAVMWYPLSRLTSPRTALSYCHTVVLTGISFQSPQLRAAARAVYERLKAEHPDCPTADLDDELAAHETFADGRLAQQAHVALATDDAAGFRAAMDAAVHSLRRTLRPELLDPTASRVLLQLAELAARDRRPWASLSAAQLLETSSLTASEHLTVDLTVNKVNRGAAFEALLHRSLLAGELQRRRVAPLDVLDPSTVDLGGRLCLWIHEVNSSFDTVVVAWRIGEGPAAASEVTLTAVARLALQDLTDGRPARLTATVCDELGEKLLGGPARHGQSLPGSVVVIASAALRSLPVEALTAGGLPVLAEQTNISVAPALASWARLPPPPQLGRPYPLLGVFDETLPGAHAEMEHLRALGRSGIVDGQAVLSPAKLGAQLHDHPYMVLSLALHGTVSPTGLILHFPHGAATGLDVLGWRLPPIVALAACRSGAAGTIRWPIDLAAACLHRGASSVIVSRWPVADDTTAAVMATVYEALADGATPGAALRSGARRALGQPLWSWANLTVFGRAD